VDAGLNFTGRFSEHRLAYAFSASRYVLQSGGDILSNSLEWEAGYQPRAWLRLTSSLAATQGRLTDLDVASASATGGSRQAHRTTPGHASALRFGRSQARPQRRAVSTLAPVADIRRPRLLPLEADSEVPRSYTGELGWASNGISPATGSRSTYADWRHRATRSVPRTWWSRPACAATWRERSGLATHLFAGVERLRLRRRDDHRIL